MSDKEIPPASDSQPRFDQRLLVVLDDASQEEDIDFGAYWRIVWGRKGLILIVALVAAILSVGLTLRMHNTYRAQVLLAPVSSTGSHGRGGFASALSRFSGLASMAGLSMGSNSSVAENLAVLKSRAFLTGFIKDNKLLPILFARRWDTAKKTWKGKNPKRHPNPRIAYRLFSKGVIHVKTGKESGLITLSVIWRNPRLAADWANKLVARLNDYLRRQAVARSEANLKYLTLELQSTTQNDMRQTLFELIAQEQKKAMIANTQKQFAFRVLDPAVPPFRKFGPHRAKFVIAVTFVAGFLAVVFVLLREMFGSKQESPESQE